MALRGTIIAATTIRNDLETRYKRLLALEERVFGQKVELNEAQIRLLEKHNPQFKERNVESPYPDYLLCQDTFYVGRLKGVGRFYMQAVVDTYSSVADLLYDRVVPFYKQEEVKISAILTDRGTEFKGKLDYHPYELFLQLNDIGHRLCKVATPRTNGFVERFNRTILDEFFRVAFRKKLYLTVDDLQLDLDKWIKNTTKKGLTEVSQTGLKGAKCQVGY